MFRFRDRKVLETLEERRRMSMKPVDIANRLDRSQSSVLRSLNRLKVAKKVGKTEQGQYYSS